MKYYGCSELGYNTWRGPPVDIVVIAHLYQGLTQEAEPVEGTYIKGFITRNWLL